MRVSLAGRQKPLETVVNTVLYRKYLLCLAKNEDVSVTCLIHTHFGHNLQLLDKSKTLVTKLTWTNPYLFMNIHVLFSISSGFNLFICRKFTLK